VIEDSVAKRARTGRGLALFRDLGEEIEHLGGQRWRVPSCSGKTAYLVDLASEVCRCPDLPPKEEVCKHATAATIARAKTAPCSGCGLRHRRRELVELREDNHDNLTYFDGDLLCPECSAGAGV